VSDLGGSQISSLMETLPGIANVLRSPVANAIVNLVRAATRLADFNIADAEELVHYATRRSLLGNDEGEQLLADARMAEQKRAARVADREKAQKARAKTKPKVVKAVRPIKAIKTAKAVKAVKKPAAKAAKKR
jgi:hypothetical protein